MNYEKFIKGVTSNISKTVGVDNAICALSGGVDSSVVSALTLMALRSNAEFCYFDDGFRKKREAEFVKNVFEQRYNINVQIYNIHDKMWGVLEGISDNAVKRGLFKGVYNDFFVRLARKLHVDFFFQGSNKADKEMYKKGQDQHNINLSLPHLTLIEPLQDLYKNQIRELARFLKLPKEITERQPFPGPGFVIRCLGEITREKINILKEAQEIAEEELVDLNLFQTIVAISSDRVCNMCDRAIPDKYILYIRAVKSKDAMKAKAIIPKQKIKKRLEERLIDSDNRVGRVMWDSISKPPATIEYI